jgi:hypothetical protein
MAAGKLRTLARSGYAARGIVYLIVGFFALLAAFGRGEAEGTKGALRSILSQPFGEILLGLMTLGLLFYGLWRFIQAGRDVDRHGHDAKGLIVRIGLFGSGVAYILLALYAAGLILPAWFGGGGGSGQGNGGLTAAITGWTYGRWVVWAVGLIVIGVGAAHILKGVKAKFEKWLQAPPATMNKVRPICRFGLIARGVVFLVIGGLILTAGATYDPQQSPTLDDALRAVQGWPFGGIVLGLIGIGLAAFGVYSLIEARWRRIDIERGLPST